MPNTSSPGWNSVTSLPTASTRPATSPPTVVLLGLAQTAAERADEVRAGHAVPLDRVDGSRVDAKQHLVVLDRRHVDVAQLEHVGQAVPLVDDRLHRLPSRRPLLLNSMTATASLIQCKLMA